MNTVVLVGRITHDLQLNYTQSGIPVINFQIAVNRKFTNQQGEREADFFRCIAWRGQAEIISKHFRKGSLIGIEGVLQSSNFETAEGERRTSIEVVCENIHFLEPKSSRGDYQPDAPTYSGGYEPNYSFEDEDDELEDSGFDISSDDDLPF